MKKIEIIPIYKLPIIEEGDDLGELIYKAATEQGITFKENDILVVTHIIVSRAEGNIVNLDNIVPSKKAKKIAARTHKDPSLVEAILKESKSIIKTEKGHIITETKHGFICANSGIDRSNVPGEKNISPLPEDPDLSARTILQKINDLSNKRIAVIISDTHGRALRRGQINIAIGIAGIKPIFDRRNKTDLFGYILKVKQTAIADEICSAAELVMGQADEGIPVAIIRGLLYEKVEEVSARDLCWLKEEAIFI
jgi:coenzyme F420-0:L-glutamate ligase/coenzyme F420-1:gamma-L-glutamate ligase